MIRALVLPLGVMALALQGCATPASAPVRITILHTNDHHGHFWRSADGQYGLAARKTLIDRVRAEVRAEGGYLLLLDGGDVNTGVPESDLQEAEPDFKGMSAIGYDAMAVGNHEFDRGPGVMQRQRSQWSSFPWLSANVYRDGQRMFEPYRYFQLGPVRVAVLGLTTEDTQKTLSPQRFPGVQVRPPALEAAALVPELRQQADVVIAATHMGHYVDGQHGSSSPGDVELARAVPGIDLIVGGHSHHPVCMIGEGRNDDYRPGQPCAPDRQNGAWIVQAWEWGKYVGRADFEYQQGKLQLVRYALMPVNLQPSHGVIGGLEAPPKALPRTEEDRELLALLQPYQQRGDDRLQQPVGRSDGVFDGERRHVRSVPTALGRLITESMALRARADLAIVSGGGIRDSLPEGPLAYRDLLKVLPFGNHLVVATLSGVELRDYLYRVLAMTPGSGAYAQVWGVTRPRQNVQLADIRVHGQSIDAGRRYRVALTSFNARGGDGYPDLASQGKVTDTGLIDVDVLRDFIGSRPLLKLADFEAAAEAITNPSR